MTSLPVPGTAHTIGELETHGNWLLEAPRDPEMQSVTK